MSVYYEVLICICINIYEQKNPSLCTSNDYWGSVAQPYVSSSFPPGLMALILHVSEE